MRPSQLAIAAAPVLFVLLWSTGFIGARYGLPYIEPLTFLAVRMAFVVLIMAAIAIIGRARVPDAREVQHALVAGSLVHGLYLGGVFTAISQGIPAGISALIPGLQPILTSTIANRFMGERVTADSMVRAGPWPAGSRAGHTRPRNHPGGIAPWLDREFSLAHRHNARHALSETLLRGDRLAHWQPRAIYRRSCAVYPRRFCV